MSRNIFVWITVILWGLGLLEVNGFLSPQIRNRAKIRQIQLKYEYDPIESGFSPRRGNRGNGIRPDSSKVAADVANFQPLSISEKNDSLVINTSIGIDESEGDFHNKVDSENAILTKDRLINAVILACAFGYAIHTILDVDHGMSRGWTQKEIMIRMPYDNWRNYENSLANSPIWTKTTINVIIYLLGDWLSQTVFNKKDILDFDPIRTFKNGFIGMCFGPLVAEYYEFSDWILPVDVGMNRLYKIFMDQTVYLGVKCSIYIAAVALLNGEGFRTAKQNVDERIKPVMLTAWKFWPFVHCITYGFIPAQHRILWVNSVDLVWNAILAALSRGENDEVSDNMDTSDDVDTSESSLALETHSEDEEEVLL